MSTASDGFNSEIRPLVYDLQMGPGRPDVPFWIEWCREAGGPVLDLGCGTGRITFPLAEAGLEVVGLDRSEGMLRAARQRLAAAPAEIAARVRLVHGDMREPMAGSFACAIIPLTTFALLLSDEDRHRTLDAARVSLRPGGRFALHLILRDDWVCEISQPPPVRRTSADRSVDFLEERHFAYEASSRLCTRTTNYTFFRPAHLGQRTEVVRMRLSPPQEIEDLLTGAGLVVESVWGGYDRRPLTDRSEAVIFSTRKPE